MPEIRLLMLASTFCIAAMMAFVAVIGPVARELGLSEWQAGLTVTFSGVLWMLLSRAWGRASDRFGRKPILMIGVAGVGLSYLLLAVYIDFSLSSPPVLWLSVVVLMLCRGLTGAFYASVPTAGAALIADRVEPRQRAGYMARMGAAAGMGMVLGPALSGVLAEFGLAVPIYVFALLPLLALVVLWRGLPSVPGVAKSDGPQPRWLDRRLRLPMLAAFAANSCVVIAQLCVGFLAIDRLGLGSEAGAKVAGYALAGVGVSLISVQILVTRLKGVAPQRLMLIGALISACGFASVMAVSSVAWLIGCYCVMAGGLALVFPSFQALAANAVGPEEQGVAAGTVSSVQGLAMILAPLVATTLYGIGPTLPYALASALLLSLALGVALWGYRRP